MSIKVIKLEEVENEKLSFDIHLPSGHHLDITEDYEGNKYNCALFFANEYVQTMNADTPEEIFNWIRHFNWSRKEYMNG